VSQTNQQIIDRALVALGVIEAGESANSTDSASSLADLNSMMAEWRESGRDLNWFSQDTLSDTCPIPDWAEIGVIHGLAVSLAAVFKAPITQGLAVKATNGVNGITRTLFNLNLEQADMSHMPQGRDSGRNILTDS